MNGLIIGGWILLAGSTEGGITVVPTQYPSEEACRRAAVAAAKDLPSSIRWRCLEAGTGMHPTSSDMTMSDGRK